MRPRTTERAQTLGEEVASAISRVGHLLVMGGSACHCFASLWHAAA
jgi:hypothetical protein